MAIPEQLAIRLSGVTHRVHRMPVLVLMQHSRCNCRCLMCDIWRANKQLQEIGAAQIERHIDAFRGLGVRQVLLSGGEALMHSNFEALCRSLAQLGARMTLLSTGLLLGRNADSIREHIHEVIVSLDGSEETHDRIRNIPRAYERLEHGVRALRSAAPDVDLGARCVIQRENYPDLAGVISAAKTMQFDWVSFLGADVSSEAFNRPGGWSEDRIATVGLSSGQCDEFEQILDDVLDAFGDDLRSGFVVEGPAELRRILARFRAGCGTQDFPPQRCNAPWVSAVIESDGTVRPCYFHEPYGILDDAGFAEIVNSPNAIRFRRNLDVNKNETCRRCVCTLNI